MSVVHQPSERASGRRRPSHRAARPPWLLALVAVLLGAGCSSGGGSATTTTTVPAGPTTTAALTANRYTTGSYAISQATGWSPGTGNLDAAGDTVLVGPCPGDRILGAGPVQVGDQPIPKVLLRHELDPNGFTVVQARGDLGGVPTLVLTRGNDIRYLVVRRGQLFWFTGITGDRCNPTTLRRAFEAVAGSWEWTS